MSQPTQSAEPTTPAADGEIKEYKIHASSKYLDLTRQKLELARLPREVPDANSKAWWNPKPTLEPLIDFWLEHFTWRDHESEINESVPQFRISIQTSATEAPTRMHFIHARSRHPNPVPLLLIPPFPFTNLSFRHITDIFANPNDPDTDQPFHFVMPSLPGLGFSDSLPSSVHTVSKTAEMLDTLMKQLGYKYYIATNSGSSITPKGSIDWKIINHLAANYTESCLGVHLVSPPWKAPEARKNPVEWLKLTLAKSLKAGILGYTKEDITALRTSDREKAKSKSAIDMTTIGAFGATLGSEKEFTSTELVTITKLTWLPGPEGALRLWAENYLLAQEETELKPSPKTKAAITVFLADDGASQNGSSAAQKTNSPSPFSYVSPNWGKQHYDVVWTSRVQGKQGLLAWERPQVIADGARNLAKALLAVDKRLYETERQRRRTA
ncbi:putative epoxide hydrolase [Trichoderma asperellum]|uniref:Putative epoxide hydrolase n=1 Tax=Trichoderma asperellum TaxID=101201 RepID=A0A6V8QYU8_TRIAP|nr:putative epoxide hydrolase [Trichoderma asperellum]